MKKEAQSIIIASSGRCTSILCDGKLYWSKPITEVEFRHKAGEMASISITVDRLPVIPDEDERMKDNFRKWLNMLMEGFLTEDADSSEDREHYKTE